MKRLLVCAALVASAGPAVALTRGDLAEVAVAPPPAARLPLGLPARSVAGAATSLGGASSGRPAVFIFADYSCRYLCGPGLTLAADALSHAPLSPGRDYRVVVLGIDPRDGPHEAAAFGAERLKDEPAVASATRLLTASAPVIAQATQALGFQYRYDAEHGQYAHPAAIFILAPDGRLARVLGEFELQPKPLAAAIRAAGQGAQPPSFAARLHALCYGLDAKGGIYNGAVQTALRFFAAGLLLALAGGGLRVMRRRRPA